jgi:photosystem II stability/assembly factor-like uncharacterized protein
VFTVSLTMLATTSALAPPTEGYAERFHKVFSIGSGGRTLFNLGTQGTNGLAGLASEALPVQPMHLLSETTGWAAGKHNLLLTQDGGHHWADITPPGAGSIESVFFLDARNG